MVKIWYATIETLLCVRHGVLGAAALNCVLIWGSILSFCFTIIAGNICDNVRKGEKMNLESLLEENNPSVSATRRHAL